MDKFAPDGSRSPLELLQVQRSHLLFVLSHPQAGRESAFLKWYQGSYRETVSTLTGVLQVEHYEQHEVDITGGKYPRPQQHYLGIYPLSLDGAPAAEGVIERILSMHRQQSAAQAPATWLYHPISEKVGRAATMTPSMLTLAFANAYAGQEYEFREWYVTRHIRHALKVAPLVSGQCFERSLFQKPGAQEASYQMIAVYEQDGTPEDILASFAGLPEGTLHFPAMDTSRFAESVYRVLKVP